MAFVMPRGGTSSTATTTTAPTAPTNVWDFARGGLDGIVQGATDARIRNPSLSQPAPTTPTPPTPPTTDTPTLHDVLSKVRPSAWRDDLLGVEDQLRALGWNLRRSAEGYILGSLVSPSGQYYDPFTEYGWQTLFSTTWPPNETPRPTPYANNASAPASQPAPSGLAGNPSVFTDPATTEWEALLRQLVDRMNQPQPTWTDAQLELMQTQSLDPLERQRTAMKQQQTQRLAQRGIVPGSGIFDEAMAAIDRQFNQLRTQTQADFATQAIGREDALFNTNEQRALNATNLFKQIPQYADARLQLAANTLIPSNPAQLLSLQQQYQQQAMQNSWRQQQMDQQFYGQLANVIATLFGGGR